MEMIKNLQINNYKSIKHVDLDCRRINVLIGEPNVGKSNILEALDLSFLSAFLGSFGSAFIKEYFRVDRVSDLFYNGDLTKNISLISYGLPNNIYLKYTTEPQRFFELSNSANNSTSFDNDFVVRQPAQFFNSPIKPYRYKENAKFSENNYSLDMLVPPFGNNLLEVVQYNPLFREFIGSLIEDTGWEFNLDISANKILIQKRINTGLVYSLPYKALADTLKRIIFYTAAIRHNNGHVITLEEPDTHAFPKFVSFLADEIIESSQQFFIATHNPYLLNNLIENTPREELAVFVCYYDKLEGTKARKLSYTDLSELINHGIDIFFNINHYLDDTVEHSA